MLGGLLACRIAGVTQLVEYLPSKQTVAGSSPVPRSAFPAYELIRASGL